MTWIIIAALGAAALLLAFSLFKRLLKLAFTALALLLLLAGIWHFSQQDPEIKKVADEAVEKAGKVVDRAGEVVREKAGETMDKAAEAIKEGAGQAVDRAAEAVEDAVGAGDEAPEPQEDPAEEERGGQ